ncbi:MAG: BrnA antitoxin family protein [Zoogloeaceae bacterium]|jgi:uncharacterized protein (DUF4415 family)|nr:BrnA antitoxin family protein [Zoogloeaceae bacterium]
MRKVNGMDEERKAKYDFSGAKRKAAQDARAKTRITIWINDDVLAVLRERAGRQGRGYQTLMNETLRAVCLPDDAPVTEKTLRRILREELQTAPDIRHQGKLPPLRAVCLQTGLPRPSASRSTIDLSGVHRIPDPE